MNLRVGIVGLPNVGKSTLFNALTKQAAEARNYPFTTIEPNVGIVTVPDERLDVLARLSKSAKITPTAIEFVDIAGLVKNAHQGEGLGNQFLSHIREVDAIVHVVRFFADKNILHVSHKIDPQQDAEVINTELILADLQQVEKMRQRLRREARGGDKEIVAKAAVIERLFAHLSEGQPARTLSLNDEEKQLIKELSLITQKPVLYLANVSEAQIKDKELLTNFSQTYQPVLALSVKIEQELIELPPEERLAFLQEYGLTDTGLNRLIKAAYQLLELVTFLTTGPTETRAWTVKKGDRAPQAAGKIHSNMERGFIRAETVAYTDLAAAGSYATARAQGKVRDEGKEYVVKDGDVMLFKFSV